MSYIPYMMNPNNYGIPSTPYQNQYAMQGNMGSIGNVGNMGTVQPMVNNARQDFIGAFVSSYEEVKSYPVPMGSVVLLMDRGKDRFYIKGLDGNGEPLLSTYNFSEYVGETVKQGKEEQQIVSNKEQIEDRLSALENKIASYEQMFMRSNNTQQETVNTKSKGDAK